MAFSINAFTIYAYPADIKDAHETAKKLGGEILDIDEELVYEKITKKTKFSKDKTVDF